MTNARQYLCGYYCNNVGQQVDRDHHFTSPILEGVVVASSWAEFCQTGENLRHPMAHQEPHTRKPCDASSSLEMAGKLPRRLGSNFRDTQAACANRKLTVTIEFDDARRRIIPQINTLAVE